MLLMEAGNDDAAHAPVVNIVGTGEGAAAIDGNPMAMIGEARADLLGKAFEAAVAIGNAAGSDDGDVHERQHSRFSFQLSFSSTQP